MRKWGYLIESRQPAKLPSSMVLSRALLPTVVDNGKAIGLTRATAADIIAGRGTLVIVPPGVSPRTQATQALFRTLGNMSSIDAWEELHLRANISNTSGLYLIDRRGDYYRVKDVIKESGGETGRIRVLGVGRAERKGVILVDPEQHYGSFIPVIAYFSKRV